MTISQFILTKLLPKKMLFIRLIQITYGLGITVLITTIFHPDGRKIWSELGTNSGKAAILVLGITLLPGMIKRFQLKGVLTAAQVFIMSIRRALGVLVYYLVVLHLIWVKILPAFHYDLDLLRYSNYELMGLIALLLLTPMALTSNDFAVRKLGKHWKRIHSAVYVVIWFIFLHVLLMEGSVKMILIAGVLGTLEIASWIVFFRTPQKAVAQQETPQQPQG